MARRVGLGPVFAFEWLMTARRWQAYAMRSLTVLLLLVAMMFVWAESPAGRAASSAEVSIRQSAQVGKAFFGSTAMILLGLVGLAAPAATAGSICLDKARGNLTLLFATDLSDAEIVLGKLAAKLVPVLGLILCAAPVLAIATLFGGIDPVGLLGALLVMAAVAIFGCSLALTLSVWGKKTHEVLLTTYVFGILYLLAAPIYAGLRSMVPGVWLPGWLPTFEELIRFNPVFLVLATLEGPPGMAPVTLGTHAAFIGIGLAASALLVGTATLRIRPVVVGQLGRGEGGARAGRRRSLGERLAGALDSERFRRMAPGTSGLSRRLRRAWPRPSLDRNPVFWRECQRKRASRMSLAAWGAYVLFCGGFSLYAIVQLVTQGSWARGYGMAVNAVQVPLGLLLLSVSAATSLAEERQRGSLDVLLATPLSTRSIVWGKWRGAFRAVPPLMILPLSVAFAQSWREGTQWAVVLLAGLFLAYGAAIASLGLALATWMTRMGRAVGLTTGIYIAFSVGWAFFAFLVFGDGPGNLGVGVAAASPFVGFTAYNTVIAGDGPSRAFESLTFWTIFWTIAHGGVAAALLGATMGTFNRCLGRIDDPSAWERGTPVPATPGTAGAIGGPGADVDGAGIADAG